MLTTSRFSSAPIFAMDWLGEALLNWGFLRTGLRRSAIEELPDHLRQDVGLPPVDGPSDPRDWRW
ncbi:hypothetical protein [Dongia deserti]|uniref:hypothetical protein n=1 Tax=Dongia deserti TaxID=2268030 RepID=UPI0013C4B29F|nr:hypothetical protein [Dongia deserti]